MTLNEVSPPGWGHTKAEKEKTKPNKPKSKIGGSAAAFKRALDDGRFKGLPGSKTKKEKTADMFKLMWSMKKKGDKPHYKPGTDKKYKKYQEEGTSMQDNNLFGNAYAYDKLKKKVGSKKKHNKPAVEEGVISTIIKPKKKVEKKPEKAMDAGARARRKVARRVHAKYVSGSEDLVPDSIREGSLRKWFKGSKSKDGKGGWVNVVTGGTCASDEPGEGTPKCVSSAKRASMTKAERLSASRRKKAADPGQQQKSGAAKPTYVRTDSKKKMNEDKVLKTVAKELAGASKMHKGQSEKIKKHLKDMRKEAKDVKLETKKNCGCGQDPCVTYGKKELTQVQKVDEACWKGYKAYGMKKKGKRMVPNCKPIGSVKEALVEPKDGVDSAKEVRKATRKAAFRPFNKEDYYAGTGEKVAARTKKYMDKKGMKGAPGLDAMKARTAEHKAKRGVKEEVVLETKDKKGKGSGTKDACYHKVKASAKVWPSAYASGRLVQCRKKGAANYGKSKSEGFEGWTSDPILEKVAAWQRKEGKSKSGGLNEKGRKSYEKANPGSDLKAPQPEGGSRKKSFCARMGGMKKKLTSAKTANDPDSRINKALRKWKC
jgi:hypothetical protein